jgi:hypothetical protein
MGGGVWIFVASLKLPVWSMVWACVLLVSSVNNTHFWEQMTLIWRSFVRGALGAVLNAHLIGDNGFRFPNWSGE